MSRDHPTSIAAFRSLLEAEADRSGLSLGQECLDRLTSHYKLLSKWNTAVRLTGDLDPRVVVGRHISDSLSLVPHLHDPSGSLLDIGSGNGFPGIILKCVRPELRLTLLEPTIRKSVFLSEVISELGLTEARVLRARVDGRRDLIRLGKWDQITLRAVAAITTLVASGPDVLNPGGRILLLVGDARRAEAIRCLKPPLELLSDIKRPAMRSSYLLSIGLSPAW
jgi:16S rRNA (guanine527-N7)-methyltransferase